MPTDKTNAYQWIWSNPLEDWVKALASSEGLVVSTRCEQTLSTIRKIAAGPVLSGAYHVYWLTFNPDGGGAYIALTDALASGSPIKWDMNGEKVGGQHITFDPPMIFESGIYIESWAAISSVIFGYCLG